MKHTIVQNKASCFGGRAPLFSQRDLLRLVGPLLVEQLLAVTVGMADTMMVSRCGEAAISGVSLVDMINNLIIVLFAALATGGAVVVSQYLGAKEQKHANASSGQLILLSALLGVGVGMFCFVLARPMIRLCYGSIDADVLEAGVLYLRITAVSYPFLAMYNAGAALFRSMGNSKISMQISILMNIINIVGNAVCIFVLGMGVDGAAIATVLSQLLSGGLCAFWFFTRTAKQEELTFRGQSSLLSAGHCKRLAYIGFPMGFEYSVSAIGAVIMQDAINLLGSTAVAAQTAGEKIRQMFTLPMESVGMAMATYVGQNHGAHRTDRIQQGIKDGCTIQLTYCVAAWVVIFFVKPYAVGLVLGDADPAVTAGAIQYLAIMSLLFCFHGLLMIFRNTLQGLGYSVQAIISGVGELIGRSLGGLLAVKTGLGYVGICLSNPFAWGLAMLYCMFMVRRMLKRED